MKPPNWLNPPDWFTAWLSTYRPSVAFYASIIGLNIAWVVFNLLLGIIYGYWLPLAAALLGYCLMIIYLNAMAFIAGRIWRQ